MKKISHFKNNPPDKYEPDFLFTIGIPFFGKASRVLAKRLIALVKMKFNVNINVDCTCFKTGMYFNLSAFLHLLYCLNVEYKFSCSRDTNLSYIGMTTQHFGIRIQEQQHHKTTKSAIRDHIETCQNCKLSNTDLNSFEAVLNLQFRMYNKNTRNFTYKTHNT